MAYHYREVSWKSKMQIEFSYNNEENIHWLPKTAFQLQNVPNKISKQSLS